MYNKKRLIHATLPSTIASTCTCNHENANIHISIGSLITQTHTYISVTENTCKLYILPVTRVMQIA